MESTIQYKYKYLDDWLLILQNNNIDYQARFNLLLKYCRDIDRLEYLNYYQKCEANLILINGEMVPNDEALLFYMSEANYFKSQCLYISSFNHDFKAMYDKCLRTIPNQKKKKSRLKNFISKYIFNDCLKAYFITWTFSDKELKSKLTSRKKKVISYLKNLDGVKAFALNVDYGELNGREHFHIILSCNNRLDFNSFNNNIDLELVNKNAKDKIAIATYITKLSNHATKSTTNYTKIYYYRGQNGS